MTNKEIAKQFQLLAQLMELHGENSYKIRSYSNAYRNLRNADKELQDLSTLQLKEIKGVGDAIAGKIKELTDNGKMRILEEFKSKTPKGIVELLGIKGLGIKKLKMLWDDLGIETPGELQYACHENRLIELKGFGKKTQDNIQKQLAFFFSNRDKFRYASLETAAEDLVLDIQDCLGIEQVVLTGAMRRLMPIVEHIDILVGSKDIEALWQDDLLTLDRQEYDVYYAKTAEEKFPVRLFTCEADLFGYALLETTGNAVFVQDLMKNFLPPSLLDNAPESLKGLDENQFFEKAQLPYIPAERRDTVGILEKAKNGQLKEAIQQKDFQGVLHLHSNWSDGSSSIEALAKEAMNLGYKYMGITDHSKSAFYANGLKEDRVLAQHKEIDALNQKLAPFKIFKGIESDILYDGNLDYAPEILAQFDFIIASVHAHLKMDQEKATSRLLTAIANPHTTILGHPTGRLLLSREGYPVDHKKIINACAKHGVSIELNANPHRLDIDYQWLEYCMEKGVRIAINPDAHHPDGLNDVRYGVNVAQKAGLEAKYCLNLLTVDDFASLISNKTQKLSIDK